MNTKYKAILRVLSFVLLASFVVNNVFVSLIVSQSRLAPGPAPALNRLLAIRVVVVGELLAGLDVARGADPDRLADDVAVAVRLARVIDEAREVAADVGVTHPAAIHREAPDAAVLQVARLACEALLVIDELARIVDDACVLRDRFRGEHAPSMHLGAPPHDFRKVGVACHLSREDNRR